MINVTVPFMLVATAIPAIAQPAAAQRATPAEAKALLQQAVAHYQKVGRAKALADFTGKKAPFVDRDLYVFCIGPDRTISAHGFLASYVGTSADALLKDADGKPLGKAIIDAASAPTGGSVRYRFINPVSGKTESKVSFVQKVGDDICGVGAYQPQ